MPITKKTDRMDIFIEEYKNTILIQQRWKYQWLTKVTPWTFTEKRKFHEMATNLIWKKWSGHFKLGVEGTSAFAQKHKNTLFTVNFNIKWVIIRKPHWKVNVIKISPLESEESHVDWPTKTIDLDTNDIKLTPKFMKSFSSHQYPIDHEFGHTIGNSYYGLQDYKNTHTQQITIHDDEYNDDDRVNGGFQLDYLSIMNIGYKLRKRHLDYILLQLNDMLPNTNFYFYKFHQ